MTRIIVRDGKRIESSCLQPVRFVPLRGSVALAFLAPAEAG